MDWSLEFIGLFLQSLTKENFTSFVALYGPVMGLSFIAACAILRSLLLSSIFQHFWHFKNSAFRTQTI